MDECADAVAWVKKQAPAERDAELLYLKCQKSLPEEEGLCFPVAPCAVDEDITDKRYPGRMMKYKRSLTALQALYDQSVVEAAKSSMAAIQVFIRMVCISFIKRIISAPWRYGCII